MENYTERDLDALIEKHLEDCSAYSNVCEFKQTEAGKDRIIKRIKQILYSEGVKDLEGSPIDYAISIIEAELVELNSSEDN